MNAQLDNPKISVIIPVYNTQEYLSECLDSLINQTLSNIEIICIDDGSTDNSVDILHEYQELDTRIKVILQENNGGGKARNIGFEHSKGKYIIFLDADDFFKNDMLEKAYLQSEKTGAEITVFNYEYYNTVSGKTTEPEDIKLYHLPKKETFNHKDMQKYILTDFCCAAWNKLYLRTFLDNHNLKFHEIQRFNDIYFTRYSLALANKITVLTDSLLYYRIGMRKNCQSTIEKYPLDFYDTLKLLKEGLESSNLWDKLEQSYKNLAMTVCVTSIHQLDGKREHKQAYNFLKEIGFKELGIVTEYKSEEYYYNRIRYLEYLLINNLPYEKYNSKKSRLLYYLSNIRLTISSYINRIHRLIKRKGLRETIPRIFTFIISNGLR